MSITFPGESAEYRAARDRLLEQEVELRRATEAMAAASRLSPGAAAGAASADARSRPPHHPQHPRQPPAGYPAALPHSFPPDGEHHPPLLGFVLLFARGRRPPAPPPRRHPRAGVEPDGPH